VESKNLFPNFFKLEITQEDIDNGTKGNSRYCPIARATRRMLSSWDDVIVYPLVDEVRIRINTYTCYVSSMTALKFLLAFDNGVPVSPCTLYARRIE
jgi:hypothetical protein